MGVKFITVDEFVAVVGGFDDGNDFSHQRMVLDMAKDSQTVPLIGMVLQLLLASHQLVEDDQFDEKDGALDVLGFALNDTLPYLVCREEEVQFAGQGIDLEKVVVGLSDAADIFGRELPNLLGRDVTVFGTGCSDGTVEILEESIVGVADRQFLYFGCGKAVVHITRNTADTC